MTSGSEFFVRALIIGIGATADAAEFGEGAVEHGGAGALAHGDEDRAGGGFRGEEAVEAASNGGEGQPGLQKITTAGFHGKARDRRLIPERSAGDATLLPPAAGSLAWLAQGSAGIAAGKRKSRAVRPGICREQKLKTVDSSGARLAEAG